MFNDDLKNQLKRKIVDVVAGSRVPIAEVVDSCAVVADVNGVYDFAMHDRKNCILWTGLCEEMVVALHELVTERRIVPIPIFKKSDLIITVISGGAMPKLPIATSLPKNGFATRRWIPTVLVAPCTGRNAAMERERQREVAASGEVNP